MPELLYPVWEPRTRGRAVLTQLSVEPSGVSGD